MDEENASSNEDSKFSDDIPRAFLCCEVKDSSVVLPESLQLLFADGKVKNAYEALTIAVHVLMLEEGFVPKNVAEEEIFMKMPSYWKNENTCDIAYNHLTCPDIQCALKTFPAGKFLAIYGQVEDDEGSAVVLNLNVTLFIENIENFIFPDQIYKNLPLLVQSFKDGMIFKLLCSVQQASGIYPTFGLTSLIEEIKLFVLSFLDTKSLVSMSALNKEFHLLANSPSLWQRLYCCDFPAAYKPENDMYADWKKLYKAEYKKQQDQLKARKVKFFPEFRPIPLPHSPWLPVLPPHLEDRDTFPFIRPAIHPEVAAVFPDLARRATRHRIFGRGGGPFYF